jgi:hypothetical protein
MHGEYRALFFFIDVTGAKRGKGKYMNHWLLDQIMEKLESELKKEYEWFESVRENLLKDEKYRGKFVAIKDEEIIDVGDDRLEMVLKMRDKFPSEVVLVTRVESEMRKGFVPSLLFRSEM